MRGNPCSGVRGSQQASTVHFCRLCPDRERDGSAFRSGQDARIPLPCPPRPESSYGKRGIFYVICKQFKTHCTAYGYAGHDGRDRSRNLSDSACRGDVYEGAPLRTNNTNLVQFQTKVNRNPQEYPCVFSKEKREIQHPFMRNKRNSHRYRNEM